MKAEHIVPFLDSCTAIFKEVAQIDLQIKGKTMKNAPLSTKNVVIMIGITGELRGNIAINLDEEFAKQIASNMMFGMAVPQLDEMSKSAISELCNMTMGRVSMAFEKQGIKIDITPPSIMMGERMTLSFTHVPLLSIKFGTQQYDMDFDISIKEA